jgi:putative membrane protein insertion efficiency factor
VSELPAASRGTAKFQLGSILGAIPLLPRNTVLLFLRAYRKVISPLYGDVCAYYPSCSAYAVGAVQQHGAIKGMFLGAWRILRCNPWTKGGVDDVKPHRHFRYSLTPRGHVVPVPTRKD